jgi:hypothetical protein
MFMGERGASSYVFIWMLYLVIVRGLQWQVATTLKAHFRWDPGSNFLGTNLDSFEAKLNPWIPHSIGP